MPPERAGKRGLLQPPVILFLQLLPENHLRKSESSSIFHDEME